MEPLLSVLDLTPWPAGTPGAQAVRNTVDLARHADALGFHRYWLSEHHNLPSIISPTPEVLLAAVGAATRRIRIGSGGVMLPNHSPLRIAEAFRILESLYPGRVDLGLGRAPGSDGRAALALRRTRERMGGDDFPELLDELLAYGGRGEFPPEHPFRTLRALPDDVALPPVWILGSSDYGARLAGRRGMGYGFAHHFSAQWVDAAAQAYHANFRPSAEMPRPHMILTVAAVCAETDAAADHLATTLDLASIRRARGEFRPLPSPEEAAAYRMDAGRARIRRGEPGEPFRWLARDRASRHPAPRRAHAGRRGHGDDDDVGSRRAASLLRAARRGVGLGHGDGDALGGVTGLSCRGGSVRAADVPPETISGVAAVEPAPGGQPGKYLEAARPLRGQSRLHN